MRRKPECAGRVHASLLGEHDQLRAKVYGLLEGEPGLPGRRLLAQTVEEHPDVEGLMLLVDLGIERRERLRCSAVQTCSVRCQGSNPRALLADARTGPSAHKVSAGGNSDPVSGTSAQKRGDDKKQQAEMQLLPRRDHRTRGRNMTGIPPQSAEKRRERTSDARSTVPLAPDETRALKATTLPVHALGSGEGRDNYSSLPGSGVIGGVRAERCALTEIRLPLTERIEPSGSVLDNRTTLALRSASRSSLKW